jgi:hypothetical protein
MATMLCNIKYANAQAGLHYFEPATMRFFQSRVSEMIYEGAGGTYFVTSERAPNGPRRYTVRTFKRDTGACETAQGCPFNQWGREKAHKVAARLSRGL